MIITEQIRYNHLNDKGVHYTHEDFELYYQYKNWFGNERKKDKINFDKEFLAKTWAEFAIVLSFLMEKEIVKINWEQYKKIAYSYKKGKGYEI